MKSKRFFGKKIGQGKDGYICGYKFNIQEQTVAQINTNSTKKFKRIYFVI